MGELEISFDRLESMTKLELDRVVDRCQTDKIWRVGQYCGLRE